MLVGGDRQGERQETKCYAGHEIEAGEDESCWKKLRSGASMLT